MKKTLDKTPGIILAAIIATPAWLLGEEFSHNRKPCAWNLVWDDSCILEKTSHGRKRHFIYFQKTTTIFHYIAWL